MSGVALDSFNTFGELLRHLRRRARLTQRELGLAVGYSEAHITRLEKGERTPDPGLVKAQFVEALGLQQEPETAQRLIALAEQAAKKSPGVTAVDAAVAAPPPTNLPVQLTSFVGREQEMAELGQLLATTRLLTLTGSGGCGKTRLAQEVASQVLGDYPDGVWLAELAPLSEPSLVADAVAAALGLRPMGRPATALLLDHLRDEQALLLLDNCEHLIQACAELAEALLRTCPHLHILATSREALRVPGETAWRVPSLAAGEAVQLFAARARAAQPRFALTAQNGAPVAELCGRLDGIPLAIELAASRLNALSVEQIAARLDDRFRLLTGGSRTALPRQQTLRATIDWSYGLLSEDERTLLQRLSVFAGGWTLEAAEAVGGSARALDLLIQLVNKSLVLVDEAGSRYTLLETIRQYAHEKLVEEGEHEQAHQHHLDYFADLAQAAKPHMRGSQQAAWLDRLEAELDNFRAALEWAAQSRDVRRGEHLIDGVWWMWFVRDYSLEGRRWVDAVLPADLTGSGPTRLTACLASGWLVLRIGIPAAYADLTQALSMAQQLEDTHQIVWAELGLGQIHPDDERAVQLFEEAASLAHNSGSRWEELISLACLGIRMLGYGDYQRAAQLLAEALAGLREMRDLLGVAWVLEQQGLLAFMQGDFASAGQRLEESVSLGRELKSDIQIAGALIGLAQVGLHAGDSAGAMAAVRESLAIYQRVGNLERVGQCLSVAAGLAQARGDLQRATTLLGAADHLWHVSTPGPWRDTWWVYDRCLPLVRAAMDPAEFDRAWVKGQAMTTQEAIAQAL
jgi:predicted ATPase/transcriptional regulator with XRE-family HTH domain